MSKHSYYKNLKINHDVSQSSILLAAFIFSFFILWNYLDFFNTFVFLFIKLGSILLLINIYLLYRQGKKFCIAIKKNYFDRYNWFKYVTYSILILILLMIFLQLPSQEDLKTQSPEQLVNFSKINPIYLNDNSTNMSSIFKDVNLTSSTLDEISNSFNSCPQINVSIHDRSWQGLSISGTSYNDWIVKGDASCRKGSKEGENLNKYYCGGYSSTFGIGSVNAYVQKTDIDNNGNIGKTTKYVIWNIYDEDKNFVETKCIGDPDEFNKEQAEAFEREMLKWN